MTKLNRGRYKCDLCGSICLDSQVIEMAEGDPFQHICHGCIADGWIDYCAVCWHSYLPEELNIEFKCKQCQEVGSEKVCEGRLAESLA